MFNANTQSRNVSDRMLAIRIMARLFNRKIMTPKEKANELFNKMDMIIYTDQDNWKSQCIRCALIAVDEILNTIEYSSQADELSKVNYWQEVKQEIEKL